jgi:AraC-like DNA-binding protein
MLAESGLSPTLFSDRENLVSLADRGRLIDRCVRATGCRHFGLLVGQKGGLHTFGLVGLLVKYSPDVGTALRTLVSHFRFHNQGAVTHLEVDGDVASFTFDIYEPGIAAIDQTCDGAVAIMLNTMRALCGPAWAPLQARFAHRQPEDIRPFRQFFGVPLAFDTEQSGLVFASHWLGRTLSASDPELTRLLQQQIEALQRGGEDDLPGQVRAVLRTSLLAGRGAADDVAALFGMHSRTLSRRLRACGTSFQQLVDECRYEIARQMLENTSLDVSDVAASLDYADASAFTRAFRRWSGTTPVQWRSR